MDKTCIESFTHKQLKKLVEIKHSTGLEDSLIIIENDRPDIDFFKYPCRIDSLVALVCLSGEMTININLNEYHIQPGTMILNLPANIVQLNSEQQCSFYGISVTRSFFEKVQIHLSDIIPVYSQLRNEPCLRLSKDEIEIFCKFISLIKLISQSTEGSKKMETLQNLGAALIWQLYDLILNYTPVSKNENKKKPSRDYLRAIHRSALAIPHAGTKRYLLCRTVVHHAQIFLDAGQETVGQIGGTVDRQLCDTRSEKPAEILRYEYPGDCLPTELLDPIVFREILQTPDWHVAYRIPE